ncbi:MAG: hypothetical protein ACRDGR_09870 [bacterium]
MQSCFFRRNVAQGDGSAIYSTGIADIYGSSISASTFWENDVGAHLGCIIEVGVPEALTATTWGRIKGRFR